MPAKDGNVERLTEIAKALRLIVDEGLQRANGENYTAVGFWLQELGEDWKESRLCLARRGRSREDHVMICG
jgi:hypothetical protein